MTHRKGPKINREGKHWSDSELKKLEFMADKNFPTPLMADSLGRTEDAVRSKAAEEGVSLKPTNKSPYNRRKK